MRSVRQLWECGWRFREFAEWEGAFSGVSGELVGGFESSGRVRLRALLGWLVRSLWVLEILGMLDLLRNCVRVLWAFE